MTVSVAESQKFVEAVRTQLDELMEKAGFPLNGVYTADESPVTSVLYEGIVSDFLTRYPGLDPVWDEDWRRQGDGCVDLWIKWTSTDDSLEVSLEHWTIRELADRYGDESSVEAILTALSGPGEIEARVGTIAEVLRESLAAAAI